MEFIFGCLAKHPPIFNNYTDEYFTLIVYPSVSISSLKEIAKKIFVFWILYTFMWVDKIS